MITCVHLYNKFQMSILYEKKKVGSMSQCIEDSQKLE